MGKVAKRKIKAVKPNRKIDWEKVFQLWIGTDKSLRAIGAECKCSPAAIHKHAKREKWPERPKVKELIEQRAQLKAAKKALRKQKRKQNPGKQDNVHQGTVDQDEASTFDEAIDLAAERKAEVVAEIHTFLKANLQVVNKFRSVVDGSINDWIEFRRLLNEVRADPEADPLKQMELKARMDTLIPPQQLASIMSALSKSTSDTVTSIRKNLGYEDDKGGMTQTAPDMIFDYGTGDYDTEVARREREQEVALREVQSGTDRKLLSQ